MARVDHTQLDHPPGSLSFSLQETVLQELEGAVDVYVNNQNLVAAHLLANAAHEVMRGYAKSKGLKLKMHIGTMLTEMTPQYADHIKVAMSWSYNAMKHFKGEVDGRVEFHPDFTQLALYHAIGDYGVLFDKLSPKMALYMIWFMSFRSKDVPRLPSGRIMFPSAKIGGASLRDRLKECRAMIRRLDREEAMAG